MDPIVVEVFHQFRAQEKHQLTINIGEHLTVIEKDPTGWWIGRNSRGQVGIFPSTYTRVVTSAPPSAEITKEMLATKLVQELQLGGGKKRRGDSSSSPGSPGLFGGSGVADVDIDDLFALSDAELEAEMKKTTGERDRMKQESANLLGELVNMHLNDKNGDDVSDRLQSERQHLTIGRRTLAELNATEAQLVDDLEDMREVLQAKNIPVPACIVEGQQKLLAVNSTLGKSTASDVASPKIHSPAPGSPISKPKKEKGDKKKKKAAAKPSEGEDEEWLAGITDRRLVPYCKQLEATLRKCNETLDQQEVSLEGLAKSSKLLEAQIKEQEALATGNEDELNRKGQEALTAIAKELEETTAKYNEIKATALNVQSEEEALQNQINAAAAEVETGRNTYLELQAAVEAGQQQVEKFKQVAEDEAELQKNTNEADEMEKKANEMAGETAKQIAAVEESMTKGMEKYKQLERQRRETYNAIQELKGNLRVYCRIKPTSSNETNEFLQVQDSMSIRIEDPDTSRESNYEFDLILGESCTQQEIFEEVRPLATSVLDGYNVCIFAYGQTGSGKTYTMEGPPSNRGVNYRAVKELFQIAQHRDDEYHFTLSVSVVEIYNDKAYDLSGGRTQTKVRWGGAGVGVVMEPLVKTEVHSVDDVQKCLEAAYLNRSVAGTDCNQHSSRSHCVLTVYVVAENAHNKTKINGKLHLIDLAGSERVKKSGVEGDRLKEAAHINTSLTHLKTVIQALANKNGHVAYRNSTLTALLQDSLGGNCKCLMFANVSAHTPNIPETLCTMKYASEARKVEVGKVTANVKKGGSQSPATPSL